MFIVPSVFVRVSCVFGLILRQMSFNFSSIKVRNTLRDVDMPGNNLLSMSHFSVYKQICSIKQLPNQG